ncbi:transcription elongation factor B polypeptide 3 [Episyrphus balteatus]|uniref:transcription elongation factor B polypeptide 3 n=1 Tax=Episyrphus balteatus TaxID=286459 RepID=UPI002486C199|nr:transcription elongation factor B polypeptide 3 [Episyrphus balteatus]
MSSDGCNIIEHYQKAIKKARNDETKLLHCIGKLDALPITIDHLQRTGVGKTVNSLRKYNGEVGDAAKGLVTKWKNMVATGEVAAASSPEKPQNGYNSIGATDNEYSTTKTHNEVKETEARLTNNNGKHKDEKRHSDRQRDSNHREEKRHSDGQRDLNHHREEKRHSDSSHRDSNHREEKRHSDREEKRQSDSQRDSNHHRVKETQSKHNDHHHESRSSSKSNGSKSNGKEKSHKSSSSHADKSNSSSSKSSSSKSSSKRHREEESSHRSIKKEVDLNDTMEPSASTSKPNEETATDTHHPKAKKAKLIVNDGIDSTMGASFSDALGMCGIGGSSKKNKKLQKLAESTKPVVETPPPRHSSSKSVVVEKQSKPTADLIPEALKTSPKTKLDISLNLPIAPSVKISDNYKPSPINQNVMNCIYPTSFPEKPASFNYDDLSMGITSKTMRTKVYSGVKTGALLSVPSLFDICIRILQKNIDALEYTGGVPFDVLRPVLERTTPQQLLNFEDYNAYLLEDTDVLWQQHVGRHYRGKMREEGETWREMFLRCEDEKERRLSILTKNIKISQKQSALPIKKTRLAYVDNVVKPPRSVQRKQEIYGTNDKMVASPAARVAALSSASHNTVVAGDPRLKIGRELAVGANSNSLRIKKAPLMAKTLQFIKKTYKR